MANIYWLPFTFYLLFISFGPMGFGLITLPISLLINLLLIPAFHDFTMKTTRYEVVNTVGLLFVTIVSGLVIYARVFS